MAGKWSDIRAGMSPERQARNRERTAALLRAMDLAETRDSLEPANSLTEREVGVVRGDGE